MFSFFYAGWFGEWNGAVHHDHTRYWLYSPRGAICL